MTILIPALLSAIPEHRFRIFLFHFGNPTFNHDPKNVIGLSFLHCEPATRHGLPAMARHTLPDER
jgi:hypothetical protein